MEATHQVLDLVYTPDEGQECYEGTEQECYDFIQQQGDAIFMYKVVPIVRKVIYENKNENKNEIKKL